MTEVFLSYSSLDRERARRLVDALVAEGLDVYWDEHLIPGQPYSATLEHELTTAACVVVLWSAESVKSDWVKDEAGRAKNRGVMLSVCIDKQDPPLGFGQVQLADLSEWNGRRDSAAFANLMRGIKHMLGQEAPLPTSDDLPTPKPQPRHNEPLPPREDPPEPRTFWGRHPSVAPLLLLLAIFALNALQTALDPRFTLASLGKEGGYPFAQAFRWFERELSFDGHDQTNLLTCWSATISYFFVFPLIAVGVAWALARRPDPWPFRSFSLAVALDYLISLPFFFLLPVPERWAQPETAAILLSDKVNEALIQAIRPFSGLDNCFPSFHVSLSVLLATACFLYGVRLRTVVAALSATVVLSTFVLGIHWLPDMIAGFSLGIACVLLAERWVRSPRAAWLWGVPR